jgi:hypothetical protein
VFDGVEHVMGILTGIWNIEQETRWILGLDTLAQ